MIYAPYIIITLLYLSAVPSVTLCFIALLKDLILIGMLTQICTIQKGVIMMILKGPTIKKKS